MAPLAGWLAQCTGASVYGIKHLPLHVDSRSNLWASITSLALYVCLALASTTRANEFSTIGIALGTPHSIATVVL